jgi:protease I
MHPFHTLQKEHFMSVKNLNGCLIAILATDGFEQSELTDPKKLLEQAGANTEVIAPGSVSSIKGWSGKDWGDSVSVDTALNDADPDKYDALVLPGGVMNPDKLRMDPDAIEFINAFASAEKPIAAICHGPWTLIEAGLVDGKNITSWPSLKTDLENAGAHWADKEVVTDGNLITSRKPSDIPAFTKALVDRLSAKA